MPTTTPAISPSRASAAAHTLVDDLQAGATAIVLVSLGIGLLGNAGLLTGGAPGLAFLLSYATGMPLGAALVAVNVPFYVLGWRRLGARFVLRTCIAVAGLAAGVEVVGRLTALQASAGYSAVAGGLLIGVGLLMMFRHRVSFGGVNILALHFNERFGWPLAKCSWPSTSQFWRQPSWSWTHSESRGQFSPRWP